MPCVPTQNAWTTSRKPSAQSEPFAWAGDALNGMAALPLIWSIPMRATMVLMTEFIRERGPKRFDE
jgi:hypothetical protein